MAQAVRGGSRRQEAGGRSRSRRQEAGSVGARLWQAVSYDLKFEI